MASQFSTNLPLIIIWFGIGEPARVLVIGLGMLAPIAISTASGVRSAQQSQINAARSFGGTRTQILAHVLLPSALPEILTGIRIALGAGWSSSSRRCSGCSSVCSFRGHAIDGRTHPTMRRAMAHEALVADQEIERIIVSLADLRWTRQARSINAGFRF